MKTGILAQQSGKENPTNLLSNGDFENWSAGTAVAPDGWLIYGASSTVAREATIIKLGTYSAKVTRVGEDCGLYQTIQISKGITYWKGRTITYGCWVYATVANRVRIQLSDNVQTISSSYHTGNSTWQFLTATMIVGTSGSVTNIALICEIDTGNTSAYFDGAMCVEGESVFAFADKPANYLEGTWTPTVTIYGAGVVPVYTTNSGRYIKIGKRVFISVNLMGDGGTEGSGVGQLGISLPFAMSASQPTLYIVAGTYQNSTTRNPIFAELEPNDANAYLNYFSAEGTMVVLSGADQNNTNRNLYLNFTYECV